VEWVETTGKTIDAAKDAALDQLGVDESDAEFEVLEEPKTGLFGRVRGEARIRARIKPARPRPKVERRDRRKRESGGAGGSGSGGRGRKAAGSGGGRADGATKTSARRSSGGGNNRSKAAGAAGADGANVDTSDDDAATSVVRIEESAGGPAGDKPSRERAPRGGRPRKSAAPKERGADRTADRTTDRTTSEAPSEAPAGGTDMADQDVTVEEQAELMATFLGGLVDAFGLEGTIEQTRVDDDTMEVQVVGDDLGLLIGPKGQTLMAVQELSRTYVQRKATGTHHGRVRIDVGGYRQRRREALERFTQQVAEQVVASGVQKALEPMNASDRKVVHDTANTIDGVRTLSEGEEPRRRVVIAPD
jgi:spoIIIJ-associated protein